MKKGQSPSVSKNINQSKQVQPQSQAQEPLKKKSEYKNKYREIEQIGKGTSGTVFLVKSKSDKIFYIAKKIILTNLNDQEKLAVEQELVLLRKLKHPHIVGYKESFIEQYYMIIIMEYCEQGDLSFHIKQKQKENDHFPERVILNWFVQLTMAIDFIHEQHVIHRDVKCSNIFLTASGSIKLGDFGISKVLHSTSDKAQTLIGTPYYLSPEVCENLPYTYQSDIWALGCVLFEMCALKHPFISESLMSLVVKIIRDPNPSIPNIYSSDLNCLIQILLAKKPENRPRTKQIFAFPFVIEVMKDFVTSKGLKQELKSLPIKKTQLHLKKETDKKEQNNSVKQIQRKNSNLQQQQQQANKQPTPRQNSQSKINTAQNNVNTPKNNEQSKQSVGSTKIQRKNSHEIKKMEELIQKQMKDVKSQVQKQISEVKGKKIIPPSSNQNQEQKQIPQSKPSTASSQSTSASNSVLQTPTRSSEIAKKQSPSTISQNKQISTPQARQKTPTKTNSQDLNKNKPMNNQKVQKSNNADEEYDRKIQEMMSNLQNKVKQEYEQIKNESPKKSPITTNNSKKIDNQQSSQSQQKQNIISSQVNSQKSNSYQPTPTQLKQTQSNDQRYNSNYEKNNNFEMTQIDEDIKYQNDITPKGSNQVNSIQSISDNNNTQKVNYHFSQKGGYNSLLQDSNVSYNLSLTNDSVFNNTAFKSNVAKKQSSIGISGGYDQHQQQAIIEEVIIENQDTIENDTQQKSQVPSEISEYHNEFLNSEFMKSNKSDDINKYQTVISEHIQTQLYTPTPHDYSEKDKSNNNNNLIVNPDDSFDLGDLPQREDYLDSDEEDNEYEQDFEVSSEEGEDQKDKNDFRLTRKNLDRELDEVIEMYKSQLMNNTNPEEYNKFKHMLNMSEIQEASVEYSTGELSRKMQLPEQNKSKSKFQNK